jgi:hypothetical protein
MNVSTRLLPALATVLAAAACSKPVPELAGFAPIAVAARESDVASDSGENGRRWHIVVRLRGPAAIVDFVRGENFLYAEIAWRNGRWLGTFVVEHAPDAMASDRSYEASCMLHKDVRSSADEAAFREALLAGSELEVRLVVGCREHVEARSQWVNFAAHMNSLRRELR